MKNRVLTVSHLKQEISVSKSVSKQQKSAVLFLLMLVANELQPMKVNVQCIGVSFVQNERNTLYHRDEIYSLICDKDRISFFPGIISSPKIFCLCFHSNSRQALQLERLEDTLSFFLTTVPPP